MSDSVWPHRWQPTRLPCLWDSPGKYTGVGCHFLLQCMKMKSESEVAQSCPTLNDPIDCSPPGSSVHEIFSGKSTGLSRWVLNPMPNVSIRNTERRDRWRGGKGHLKRRQRLGLYNHAKKGNAKKCSNYHTIALISHASKVMLKIHQARLQQYMNCELPDVQAGLEKAEEPEIKLPTSSGSWKKQESSRKTSLSALLTMPKPLTVWITINCGKFWKRWEYQTTWPASWEICMQGRKQQLELDIEQLTGFK